MFMHVPVEFSPIVLVCGQAAIRDDVELWREFPVENDEETITVGVTELDLAVADKRNEIGTEVRAEEEEGLGRVVRTAVEEELDFEERLV